MAQEPCPAIPTWNCKAQAAGTCWEGGFVGLGGRGSENPSVWVRVVRGGRFPMDHWESSQEEEMALGRLTTLASIAPVGAGGCHP